MPLYNPTFVLFDGGSTRPRRLPTDIAVDLVPLIPQSGWPAWLTDVWHRSVAEYGTEEQRKAAGVDTERDQLRQESATPIGASIT